MNGGKKEEKKKKKEIGIILTKNLKRGKRRERKWIRRKI